MYDGIDKENATMVVIPTILKDRQKVKELMRKLEVFYLANKSENLYFCLLGDCSESDKKVEDFDQDIIDEGIKQVEKLNKKYMSKKETVPSGQLSQKETVPSGQIFHFAYRKRKWNDIGKEKEEH